jgi:hypothetical protein
MAWLSYRKAQPEDFEKLDKMTRRFAARRGWSMTQKVENYGGWITSSWYHAVDDEVKNYVSDQISRGNEIKGKYVQRLWFRCVARALNEPGAEGVAWDSIGKSVADG